jgi:glycerol-3-phosphate dehydrogenase
MNTLSATKSHVPETPLGYRGLGDSMALEQYDLVIVGGGIVGAGILREAALHNLKVLLVDKKDFSSQTSQASSKMLHGGIRYLETFDFDLVSESLHEKNLWLRLTPHLCFERAFYLPLYKKSTRPPWMMKIGLTLYDFLSGFQNKPHHMASPEEVLKVFPNLETDGLLGAGVYYDAVVEDAKLSLEVIYDALVHPNATALNYTECIKFTSLGESVELELRNTLNRERQTVMAKNCIFATGPFTDQLLQELCPQLWRPRLLPSKGSHLWIDAKRLPITESMVLTPADGRVIFVIPQRGSVLVGTTEVPVEEKSFFDLKISEHEKQYLLQNLNETFPGLQLAESDILSSFSGVRPLVKAEDTGELGKTARDHLCSWPMHNVGVIIGGKYTTFRVMAQDIMGPIMKRLHLTYDLDRSKRPLRRPSASLPFKLQAFDREMLENILKNEQVKTLDDLVVRRLGLPAASHWMGPGSLEQFLLDHADLLEKYGINPTPL